MKIAQSTIEPAEFKLVKPYSGNGKMYLRYRQNAEQIEDNEGNLIWQYEEAEFIWLVPKSIKTFEEFCSCLGNPVTDPFDGGVSTVREQIKAYVMG